MEINNELNYSNPIRKDEYILCAAIHYNDGEVYPHQPKNIQFGFVVAGRRHSNCFQTLSMMRDKNSRNNSLIVQGFITSHNRFLDRIESSELALRAKQILEDSKGLMSEDLY